MNIRKAMLYYQTIKHLKWVQLKSRLFNGLPKISSNAKAFIPAKYSISLQPPIASYFSYEADLKFTFLNQAHQFNQNIDWNYSAFGKLWTYNLNYFEFLNQPDFPKEIGIELIQDFIQQFAKIKDGLEPYPISLRIISWIKFIAKYEISNAHIDINLWQQIQLLEENLEYHLLGNHLLENAFGLLFGGLYFQDVKLLNKASELLKKELGEQILADGGHFELSPMYHLIILNRVLDSINLLTSNEEIDHSELLNVFQDKATIMLGWSKQMEFKNGDLPRVNDSADLIAPTSASIYEYANRLGIQTKNIALKESGYRKYYVNNYEVLMDVGNIGPDYIPGHAHSDTLNFILHHNKLPILVDTGISTYEKNARRQKERSTAAHNTVMCGGQEQSQVWGGFRVGRRAKITALKETKDSIEATHNGYSHLGIFHTRKFSFSNQQVKITDVLNKSTVATAYFHFHPDCEISTTDNEISAAFGNIEFENMQTLQEGTYEYARGFNELIKAKVIAVNFTERLVTKINLA